jgi:DNA-3-methyladenine glycosylase I
MKRCEWAATDLSRSYHDAEWGVPLHDDRALFELLILEGAQAGLSWEIILKKRENYRRLFDNFDAGIIARYDQRKIAQLLADSGIVRNQQKITAAIVNARALAGVQSEFESFDSYVWHFVGGRPKLNSWRSLKELPAQTAESEALSKDLRRRGFKFVGPTICYAFMQAAGLVNDHVIDCFRYKEVSNLA